ncbi:MarR family winged helix-turn-helix transcriptional regulator [Mucilaginibacter sp. BJC16-A38]|uniref:MarR family winged helix-turn-helix transcriptional regulator n=1 Tax=Mucilaginibacter phenanthrenivorans TaxID=1234842 RepID=UPI00215844FC|nr:MarR family transcriptional regulator [Mucilaginibacter phenanthrenivorans]MCR8558621.1 MarR family winged helix-turn-helix transcriptional regulator [Mucilaginibacter phenanthrenivorans]
MNLYQSLGYLVLGSRLRRLSEGFLAEINRAYQNERIDFDASWFPVFYLLSKNESLSIKELSEQTEVSHPAASQLITNLKNRKLVTSATCADDGRRQLVQLTDSGRTLLTQIMPVWDAILLAMNEVLNNDPACKELLPSISALENAFRSANLADRISDKLNVEVNAAANE